MDEFYHLVSRLIQEHMQYFAQKSPNNIIMLYITLLTWTWPSMS